MRRQFNRPRSRGTPFRRKARTTWLTDARQQGEEEIELTVPDMLDATTHYLSLQEETNDFVSAHPRFAQANDVISLRRIVGRLRGGLYLKSGVTVEPEIPDILVTYGFCLVKGDYNSDGSVWTPLDLPDPKEPADEDDKWLWKNQVMLTPLNYTYNVEVVTHDFGPTGSALLTEAAGTEDADAFLHQYGTRPGQMSTDQQLPMGSYVDIKTKRKLQYAERLMLATTISSTTYQEGAEVHWTFFWDWMLRILTKRYG